MERITVRFFDDKNVIDWQDIALNHFFSDWIELFPDAIKVDKPGDVFHRIRNQFDERGFFGGRVLNVMTWR